MVDLSGPAWRLLPIVLLGRVLVKVQIAGPPSVVQNLYSPLSAIGVPPVPWQRFELPNISHLDANLKALRQQRQRDKSGGRRYVEGAGDRAPGADVTGVRRAFGLHQKCELTTARPAGGGGRNNSNEYSNEYAKSC